MPQQSKTRKLNRSRRDFLGACLHRTLTAGGLSRLTAPWAPTKPLLRNLLHGSTATILSGGCIARSAPDQPERVWGRRGFSPGRFLKPRAITIDNKDQLYIVDTTGRIQVFDADGNYLRHWKTPQTKNGRPTGLTFINTPSQEPAKNGNAPSRLKDSDQGARLLVADTHYYRMLSYSPEGVQLPNETIGGVAGIAAGEFAFVTDIACDEFGYRYIGEYNASDRIQKFDRDGNFICQWGGSGNEPGSFIRPQSLVIRDNVLWVADSCNHRIQRFDISTSTPELIDIWGKAGTGPGEFFYPYDLAIASDGSVVVIEYKNNRLQRFSPEGKWLATWGSPGFEPGKLNQPWGVVIDSKDRVHILDSNNHRVQRIQLPG